MRLRQKRVIKSKRRQQREHSISFLFAKYGEYFRIGASQDFILIRDDFPLAEVSPKDLSRLCLEMFLRNDEALNGK